MATRTIPSSAGDFGNLTGLNPVIFVSGNTTLSPSQVKGQMIEVTGAGTTTLPPGAKGMNSIINTRGNIAVSVKPAAGEVIMLNGVALTADYKVMNTSTAGDVISIIHNGSYWEVLGPSTWTDGGV